MKILLVVLVLLVGAIVAGAMLAGPQLQEKLSALRPAPPTTEVRVEPAVVTTLVESISAPGEIEPHTRVAIAAEVSARIVELPFREGLEVRKGDMICQLDDRDLKALLVSTEARRDGESFRLQSDGARLQGLWGNLTFAQTEHERMQALYDGGDVSRRDLDNIIERVEDLKTSIEATQYSISVVESSLAAAEAEIARARDGLNKTVIVAPMDGVITVLNVEVGEIVTGSTTNPGTVLMVIADLTRMIMKARISESDIARVEVGQQSKLFINAYPDDTYSGTVRQIALQRAGAADGTGFFETEVEIDLQGRRIYSGLVANVNVEIEQHEGLVVPYQAILAREVDDLPENLRKNPLIDPTKRKTHVLFRAVDGKAVCTIVKPGPSDLTHRVVLEGLEEGDRVIVGPYKVLEEITDATPISIAGESDSDSESETESEAESEAEAESTIDSEGEGDGQVDADESAPAPAGEGS